MDDNLSSTFIQFFTCLLIDFDCDASFIGPLHHAGLEYLFKSSHVHMLQNKGDRRILVNFRRPFGLVAFIPAFDCGTWINMAGLWPSAGKSLQENETGYADGCKTSANRSDLPAAYTPVIIDGAILRRFSLRFQCAVIRHAGIVS